MSSDVLSASLPDLEEWPEHPDVPGTATPEPLPVECLPGGYREHVESVAAALQVPSDLPLVLGLATVSAAVAGRVEVAVRAGWREPVNLYAAAVLPPASRKSPAYSVMTPIRDLEADAIREAVPRVLAATDKAEVAEEALRATKSAAAKGKATPDEVEAARFELEDARRRVPPTGRLLAGDITPEAMVLRMAEQGGRLAILEPEPGPLQLIAGRYSDSARLDEVKKAWSGEALTVDRVGRPPLQVRRPALTLALCLQPGVLEGLENGKAFRYEGVLARFLWVQPPHGLGTRLTGPDVPRLDEGAQAAFVRIVGRLWGLGPANVEEDGTEHPHVLSLSPDALDVLHLFEAEVELHLGDGGRFESIRDWGGKAVGQAVRVACLLDLAARANDARPLIEPVSGWAMESAVRLIRAASSHALAVLAPTDAKAALLAYVLKRASALPEEEATVRGLYQATKGKNAIDTVEDLEPLLRELVDRGCVRFLDRSTGRPGRPHSPGIEVHPALRENIPTNPTNTSNGGSRVDSEDYGDAEGLSKEDRQYLEDERAGMQMEEVPTTPRPSDDDPLEVIQEARDDT